MKSVVDKLSDDDILNISAYLASVKPVGATSGGFHRRRVVQSACSNAQTMLKEHGIRCGACLRASSLTRLSLRGYTPDSRGS